MQKLGATVHATLRWLVCLSLAWSSTGWADAKDKTQVYLEPDCLGLLGPSKKVPEIARNETPNQTYVEEDQGALDFDRVTVIEKRDGDISEAYVQIRNCKVHKNSAK